MDLSFLAVIVVYGSKPAETPSLRSLARCRLDGCTLRTIVWDNSLLPDEVDWSVLGLCGEYVSTPANLGLSTIYNRVIASHLRQGEYLLLLDQDTALPDDYLLKAQAAITAHPDIGLFLPMVRANGRWASPVTYMCGWGRQWTRRQVGEIASSRICAINSGMIISDAYLLGSLPAYDERLRFYGTDTQFMLDYMESRRSLCMMDTVIDHDLSFFSAPSSTLAKKFAVMKSAYDVIYEKRPWIQRIAVRLMMLAVSIRYALKYRDLAFLRGDKS